MLNQSLRGHSNKKWHSWGAGGHDILTRTEGVNESVKEEFHQMSQGGRDEGGLKPTPKSVPIIWMALYKVTKKLPDGC